jgi:hypothetical protein
MTTYYAVAFNDNNLKFVSSSFEIHDKISMNVLYSTKNRAEIALNLSNKHMEDKKDLAYDLYPNLINFSLKGKLKIVEVDLVVREF